jgi:hypothetical protein
MTIVHRLLAIVVIVSMPAMADTTTPDGGVNAERAQRSQQAVDDLRNRLQTNEEVAANLTPDERLMLLSGIICDAEENAKEARATIREERAKRPTTESIDSERVHEQETIVRQQEARISQVRKELGRHKPTLCKSTNMRAVVNCIRTRVGPATVSNPDCRVRDFWKYRRALMDLDPQWRNMLFPRNSQP